MIYNSFGVINEEALERLCFISEVGKYFGKLEGKSFLSENELSYYFPTFIWLLRDFTLELKNHQNQDMTADEYLEQILLMKSDKF